MKRAIEHKAILSDRVFVSREWVLPGNEAQYTFHFAPREINLRRKQGVPLYDVQAYTFSPEGESELFHNVARYLSSIRAAGKAEGLSEFIEGADPIALPPKKERQLIGRIASIDTVDCLVAVNKLDTPYFLLLSEKNAIPSRPNGNATTLAPEEAVAFGTFILHSVPASTRQQLLGDTIR